MALAAVCLCGLACGGDDGGSDRPTIGCVLKSTESPFWIAAKQGCEKGAREAGAELVFGAAETEADVAGQIAEVEDALTRGVDALVVAPSAPDQLRPVLERAARDVPVLLVDTDIPDWDGKTSYIGTDNVAAGALGAKHIAEKVGTGTFGMLTGDPGVTSVEDRVKGARQAFQAAGIEVASVLNVRGCTRDQGVSQTEDMLTAHPDLDGIFAVCDQPLLGGVEAIRKAGKKPGDLFLLGFDAVAEAVDLVERGVIDGDVAQFPAKMGELGVKHAVRAARDEDVPKVIDSGAEVVTRANAARFK